MVVGCIDIVYINQFSMAVIKHHEKLQLIKKKSSFILAYCSTVEGHNGEGGMRSDWSLLLTQEIDYEVDMNKSVNP